ncbi:hypothetical protein JW992_14330 [candidate division KSB1 bacterium]|nr:hypothetical protein [candidate division KSB1 bacterium]
MITDSIDWQKDFPLEDEFEDFTGKKRVFRVDCHNSPLGYTVRAVEVNPKDEGYEFSVYSETNPYDALGRLREKARRAMAVRHLSSNRDMLHDKLCGRITVDEDGAPLLVVDGIGVDRDDLARILSMYEGFVFTLTIENALK